MAIVLNGKPLPTMLIFKLLGRENYNIANKRCASQHQLDLPGYTMSRIPGECILINFRKGRVKMEELTKVLIGLIIGGSIGLILAIGFILIAIQFGWVNKFVGWLEDKL